LARRLACNGRRVRDDSRGATLIEFALVTPAFVAILLAILQTALVFLAQESLESAAEVAARKITTGYVQANIANESDFQSKVVCPALPVFMKCGNLMVDVENATSFSAISTATPVITFHPDGTVANNWNYSVGGAGDIVVLRLMYIWSVQAGPLNFSLSNLSGSQRLLVATTVAKTEPYTG
jgi:Flp pilus assembly protein TadG